MEGDELFSSKLGSKANKADALGTDSDASKAPTEPPVDVELADEYYRSDQNKRPVTF